MRDSAGRNMRDDWFFCHQRFKERGPQAKSEIESTKSALQLAKNCCFTSGGIRMLSQWGEILVLLSATWPESAILCQHWNALHKNTQALLLGVPARPPNRQPLTNKTAKAARLLTHISSFRALPTSETLTVYFSVPVRAGKLLLPREMVVLTRIQLRPMRSL